jgi:hypothetical protein
MNDFNQSETQLSLGFEEYPDLKTSIIPDFNQVISKKVETIKNNFDPYKLMVKKKEVDSGEVEDNTPKQTWPEKDIQTLEDFCKQYGIAGFNCGRMSPIAALAFLKQKLGIADGPLEERIPYGYEKIVTNSSKTPVSKKMLIKG